MNHLSFIDEMVTKLEAAEIDKVFVTTTFRGLDSEKKQFGQVVMITPRDARVEEVPGDDDCLIAVTQRVWVSVLTDCPSNMIDGGNLMETADVFKQCKDALKGCSRLQLTGIRVPLIRDKTLIITGEYVNKIHC